MSVIVFDHQSPKWQEVISNRKCFLKGRISAAGFGLLLSLVPYQGLSKVAVPEKSERGLYFKPEKNGFRFLNQKLSFQMVNHESFRLGTTTISRAGMRLELVKSENSLNLRFIGPKKFMESALLLLRDPNGKVLWKKSLQKELPSEPLKLQSPAKSSEDLLIIDEKNDVEETLTTLTNSIFFKFCLLRESELRRLTVCSEDYKVKNEADTWTLNALPQNVPENNITINGVEVDGDTELDLTKDFVATLSAKLASGLLIEARVRAIPVDILDYDYQLNNNILKFYGRQYELGRNKKIFTELTKDVPISDPSFYLDDENSVSLQQIVVKDGQWLASEERPRVVYSPAKTYSGVIDLPLDLKSGFSAKAMNASDGVKTTETSTVWSVRKLKPMALSSRQIELRRNKPASSFIASYDLIRGPAWDLAISGYQTTPRSSTSTDNTTQSRFEMNLNYHVTEEFFGPQSWNYLRWLVLTEWRSEQYTNAGDKHLEQTISIDTHLRLQPGLQTMDPSWSIGMGYVQKSSPLFKRIGAGLSLRYEDPVFESAFLGDRVAFQLKWIPSLQESSQKLKENSLIELQWRSRYSIDKKWSWSWSPQISIEEQTPSEGPKLTQERWSLGIGLHRLF